MDMGKFDYGQVGIFLLGYVDKERMSGGNGLLFGDSVPNLKGRELGLFCRAIHGGLTVCIIRTLGKIIGQDGAGNNCPRNFSSDGLSKYVKRTLDSSL